MRRRRRSDDGEVEQGEAAVVGKRAMGEAEPPVQIELYAARKRELLR